MELRRGPGDRDGEGKRQEEETDAVLGAGVEERLVEVHAGHLGC